MKTVQDPQTLFGKLIPFRHGKLVRRWAIELAKDEFYYSLGTHRDCDVVIRGWRLVEPYHCRIEFDPDLGVVRITNRSRLGGTWVNGALVSTPEGILLRNNDKVSLGAPMLVNESRVFVFESSTTNSKCLEEGYVVDWHRPIGSGASCAVWKARKRMGYGPKAYRAVKILHCEADDTVRKAYITNEIKLATLLVHPNICTFYEALQDPQSGKTCLILELSLNGNLERYVGQHRLSHSQRGIDALEARHLTEQLCSAVSYMHSLSVVHRDLKPANILVTSVPKSDWPVIKITDFGLSKQITHGAPLKTICGTPAYAAPEVVQCSYGSAVDSWSVGAIVVYM
ncbi:unnamed protein product [Peniophora sp. CBMAI 1063]|nr:unnamed protein product [Peniophora sp. CBMAI 1063]